MLYLRMKCLLPQFGEVSKFKNNYDAKYFYFLLVEEHVNRPRSIYQNSEAFSGHFSRNLRDSGVVKNL